MWFEQSFLWIIILPVAAAPAVYLVGRLQQSLRRDPSVSLSHLLACLVMLLAWIPLGNSAVQYLQSGPLSINIQDVALRFDGLSLLLSVAALGLGTLVVVFSGPALRRKAGEEKYFAMLLTMVGVMIALGCAADLFNLWVWFEAMAVSSYLLVVFNKEEPASLEAGVKYVVQSAAGSTLVLLGIALVLMTTGSVTIADIAGKATATPALLAAGALFVAGFGVKAALVPMHTWLPDAHSQAPAGISAMLSGVVIEAGLIAMLRALAPLTGNIGQGYPAAVWGGLLIALGAVNMLLGNLMALRQAQVKRLLAYSSLSHIGYIVFGVGLALSFQQLVGAQGGMFHLLTHSMMKGLAFLSAGALLYALHEAAAPNNGPDEPAGHQPLMIADLDGAAQRYPLAALAFSLAVLALGGLPPLAGFMSKWQIFTAGFTTQNAWMGVLVVYMAFNSVLSLGYYAPLVNAIYRKQPCAAVQNGGRIPWQMSLPLVALAVLIITFGLAPGLAGWITAPAGQSLLAAFGG